MCEQWRGRCPVTGLLFLLHYKHLAQDGLSTPLYIEIGLRCIGAEQFDLLRWDSQKPLAVDNLVLMETNAMKKFIKDGELSSDVRAHIESVLKDSFSCLP